MIVVLIRDTVGCLCDWFGVFMIACVLEGVISVLSVRLVGARMSFLTGRVLEGVSGGCWREGGWVLELVFDWVGACVSAFV